MTNTYEMTPAEITAHILADCRRVYLVTDKPMEALYNMFVNQAIFSIVIGIVRDVRRMN